ncbi:hypothetical protein QFC19_008021 [Naganishia cerealis]|uniref:Uncharacterized protein n=1 Tax=Naganishia cerealis TaxID=610337 RepID=A0ACC2V5P5_9TREE|nr:hypothetical protein QFC19_008021 [Naganishia cerealis]
MRIPKGASLHPTGNSFELPYNAHATNDLDIEDKAGSGTVTPQSPNDEKDPERKGSFTTKVLEQGYVSDNSSGLFDEAVEITPMEAFRRKVDGDESPFPEVQACVPTDDDPTIQINHFRMWFLLTLFVILFAGVNQFFALRYPSLTIGYVVAQILLFPIGKAWEKLPELRIGTQRFGFRLNPGKFTIKEHALIVICVNLTGSSAYALGSYVAISSPVYWNRDYGAGFCFVYLLTTQMLGFGLAGLARRWLVYPAALIWPSTLSSTVLFRALHENSDKGVLANGWKVSRYRYFSLGLIPISLDWTVINYAGNPLTTPFYITANCFAVIVIFYLFVAPILYYSNVWNSGYLPLLSSSTFDNTGKTYNITRVVDKNLDFVLEKYEQYSPMYISMSYSLSYALSFASVTAILFHTVLYNGKEIVSKFKDSRAGGEDVHKRKMNAYREVPDWWYMALTVVILGLGIFTIRYWDTQLPVWGFIVVCFGMGMLLIIPEGLLEGTTNQRVFLNIITELIAGYIWPGKPIANMMVKFYGYNSVKHGLDFAQDLKLGQYMKIAPRILFVTQIYSSVLSTAVQTGVLRWMYGHIEDLCKPTNKNRFTCNGSKVVYNASIIWGTIGPQRLFQAGQVYNSLMYFFLIGPMVTCIVYVLYRQYPNSWVRFINVPIFFNAAGNIPPANTTQYSLWFIVGFIFNYLIRKKAFAWWKRYNYLTQAALDTGVALATIIIFFALSYNGIKLVWGGNTIGSDTYDSKSIPYLSVASGKHFGKGPGEF